MGLITEVLPRRQHIFERKDDDDGHRASSELPSMPARFSNMSSSGSRNGRTVAVPRSPSMDVLLVFLVFFSSSFAATDTRDTSTNDIDGRVLKQWGLPDTTAQVGKLFRYHIPADAFTGQVHHYHACESSSESLPSWLQFNASSSILEGVPTLQDLGQVYLIVKAIGFPDVHGKSDSAQDVFSLDVLPYVRNAEPAFMFKDANQKTTTSSSSTCEASQESMSMSIVLDADIDSLKPADRINLMTRLAEDLGIAVEVLHLLPYTNGHQLLDTNTVMAGPGDAREKRLAGVVVHWQVGCGSWTGFDTQDSVVNDLERKARDGYLGKLLGVPVVGWHLSIVQPPRVTANRQRRQAVPFGFVPTPVPAGVMPTKLHRHHETGYDSETGIHEIYPEETEPSRVDEDEGPTPDVRIVPTMASPTFTLATTAVTHHRHRHHHELGTYPRGGHHGRQPAHIESGFTTTPEMHYFRGTPVMLSTPSPTPALPPILPTRPTPQPDMTDPVAVTATHDFLHPSSSTVVDVPDIAPTRTSHVPTTSKTATTPNVTHQNFVPVIVTRIPKLSFIAGKITYAKIAANTFWDFEQGETPNLKLILMSADGTALHANSWIQFDAKAQTIYAVPVEENIGKWDFVLEAIDNEGSAVRESVEVHVRQHPSSRAVHHEFVLQLKYDNWRFPFHVDWQVKLADKLAEFYGDRDTSNILVRSITTNPLIFTWTNDSLLAQPCPHDKIMDLMQEMATREGHPTKYLRKGMTPEFRVQTVHVNFLSHCKAKTPPPTPQTHINMKPEVPNQIDEISATAGQYLLYKVPDDTFNDEEDGDTPNLHLTFLTINGAEMPRTYWLKFVRQRREFIGLPMDEDVGRREYQLVATDKNGSSVADALEVVVYPRDEDRRPSVEFSIVLDASYDAFNNDLFKKVMVLDKLARVFGDEDPRNITVHSITRGSVVFAWSNNTLPYEPCPTDAILRLVGIMFNDNGTVSKHMIDNFSPDFNVTGANVMPLGLCLGDLTPTLIIAGPTTTVATETATSEDDVYVTTIIPAVVIAVMLLIAAIIACALYRKRRKGKMTMDSDNGNFVNKGIPIIFADELVDKPDPAKSPVILKEEKPPLPPPEYPRSSGSASPSSPPSQQAPDRPSSRRGGGHDPRQPSVHGHQTPSRSTSRREDPLGGLDPTENTPPYQPPQPFTASRDSRLNRPKYTPTYRLPPPYVPP